MAEFKEPIEGYSLNRNKESVAQEIISKVGIVGCGLLGQEIARLAASSGFEVVFIELSDEKISQTLADIEKSFDHMIDRWEMTSGEKRSLMGRIAGSTNYEDLKGCDLVIESIKSRTREDAVEIRKRIFKNVEEFVSEDCIIATNSTTLVITELSADLKHPSRCVSMHFPSPASDTRVVEIVKSLYTTDRYYNKVCKFASMLGKKVAPVLESPGLISTRLIAPYINDACSLLLEGVATKEDIDMTMKLGMGLPMGPLEMADSFGLKRVTRWLDNLYNEFGDPRYKASPILRRMVRAKLLGKEVRKGFYTYTEDGVKIQ
ncbi:MAG: 3-hydroxyacyl-CoA dehydrogenase NAD-binding domain-containing protein [Cytophagales bacterium]|nr:3-hydroxyacyl-CoA dehydrogenase NAD-binding domain-containing protein [Cytophagales bacterium]